MSSATIAACLTQLSVQHAIVGPIVSVPLWRMMSTNNSRPTAWFEVARCIPMWSDVVLCAPMWSHVVRCGPMWSDVVISHTPHWNLYSSLWVTFSANRQCLYTRTAVCCLVRVRVRFRVRVMDRVTGLECRVLGASLNISRMFHYVVSSQWNWIILGTSTARSSTRLSTWWSDTIYLLHKWWPRVKCRRAALRICGFFGPENDET